MSGYSAILFLAPLSGFDQVLAEDETVNRLEDSVLRWKSICSNPLLGKTILILFLNKIDILKSKLRAGIQLADYIVSYGSRPNDYESASNCKFGLATASGRMAADCVYWFALDLRRKFSQIHKEHTAEPRVFYCHFTAVTVSSFRPHSIAAYDNDLSPGSANHRPYSWRW